MKTDDRSRWLFLGCCSIALWNLSGGSVETMAQSIVATPDGTGTVVFSNGDQFNILGGTQAGSNLYHSFQRFNLNAGEVATFLATPGIQNILSRVVGGEPSLINGLVQVSGGASPNLYLMNPAGIVFGPSATLNVPASFTATTANGIGIGDGWFKAQGQNDYAQLTGLPNQLGFATLQPGTILNAGKLIVPNGESLTLVGGIVINTGTLVAPGGNITILAIPGDRLVRLTQSGSLLSLDLPLADQVAITAAQIPMTALSLPQLLTGTGPMGATGLAVDSTGTVRLVSHSSPIPEQPGTVIVAGSVSVATDSLPQDLSQPYKIQLLGEQIALLGAQVDASGPIGGTVLVGGDYQGQGPLPRAQFVYGDSTTVIRSDGVSLPTMSPTLSGQGGTVILWSDNTTRFYGMITARGGQFGGNGGVVETSGAIGLDVAGASVDTQASQGQTGVWLLDPSDIKISAAQPTDATGNPNFFSTLPNAIINTADLQNALLTSNVSITTAGSGSGSGDIVLESSINSTTPDRVLTLTTRFLSASAGSKINLGPNSQLQVNFNVIKSDPAPGLGKLQSAIDTVGTVSDTVFNLAPATYSEALKINLAGRLTLQGAAVSQTILSGGGTMRVLEIGTAANVVLNQLTVTDGKTSGIGGGILNLGTLKISKSIISNSAASQGGGIFNLGLLEIEQTTLQANQASNGAGLFNRGTALLERSTLSQNQSLDQGGGVSSTGPLTLLNSTVSGNRANGQGGGINNAGGSLTLLNSTVTKNQADGQGNGVFNGGIATVKNTIIAGNTNLVNPSLSDLDVSGSFQDAGNNLIGVASPLSNFILSSLVGTPANPLDARLAPLANNGGVTATHALLLDSPAINAGNAAGVSGVDQRGAPRVLNGSLDIGAYEIDLTQPISSPSLPENPVPLNLPADNLAVLPLQNGLSAQLLPNGLGNSTAGLPMSDLADLDLSLTAIDQSLGQEFSQYLGLKPKSPTTIQQLRKTLNRIRVERGINAAVIYAIYVPSVITPVPKLGTETTKDSQRLPLLLRSRDKQGADRLELLFVTASGKVIRRSVAVTRSEVQAQAKLFRIAAADPQDERGFVALSQQLYGWLLEPLIQDVRREGITTLIYVLDEGLRTVPIAAMADEQGFLISRYAISIVPNIGLTDYSGVSLKSQPLLAMGADRFKKLEPLPAATLEVQLLSRAIWGGAAYLNEGFTLANILTAKNREQPAIIHLATHAQFNEGAAEQSYIQLWDSQITLNQISSLRLGDPVVELLVLSACLTAFGSREAELGFAGIAAASNAKTVLGSLWTVSDIGTLALMSEFYTQLKTAPSRSEALRRAQLAMLQGLVYVEANQLVTTQGRFPLPKDLTRGASGQFDHPFYWSAFTLIGSPW